MTAITAQQRQVRREARLRVGAGLMAFGALAFVGHAVIFFILDFTDRFLELGIGAARSEASLS